MHVEYVDQIFFNGMFLSLWEGFHFGPFFILRCGWGLVGSVRVSKICLKNEKEFPFKKIISIGCREWLVNVDACVTLLEGRLVAITRCPYKMAKIEYVS